MNNKKRTIIIRALSFKYKLRGYSEIAADEMVARQLTEHIKGKYPRKVRKIAKKYGFLPSTVLALGITEDNHQDYLSDNDYYKLTPLNGIYHPWVNNKISLKYLLGEMAGIMPKYYFQIIKDGEVIRMFECSKEHEASVDGIISLLRSERVLALKRLEGYGGAGFYKVYYSEKGQLYLNDEICSEEKFRELLFHLSDYLVMEYLECSGLPAQIYPKTANSIRVIFGKVDGELYSIGNFIKFGNLESGYVDNLTGGGISCPIDNQGMFRIGYTKEQGVMIEIEEHPDTHAKLSGKLDEWEEIIEMAHKVMERLPQLSYCGFDFVISDKGIKILEINDMSGFLTLQKDCPLLKNKENNFYLKRLEKLNF